MAVVFAPNATQGARLVVDDVNCQAVCGPDGEPIGGNVTVEGPLGAQTAAASVAVTQGAGANNLSTTQVATATTQVSLANSRPTRKSIVFENLDAAITIYVGPTGITSSTGYPIPFGQARVFTWTGQFFAVSASGTPLMAVSDEFD